MMTSAPAPQPGPRHFLTENKAMIALKSILVPTDFSEPSAVALRYAKAFAESFGASLHLLHVIEDALFFVWEAPPLVRDDIEAGARRQLDGLLTDAERERFGATLVTRSGSPFLEIVRYAHEQGIDLIV